MTVQLSIAVRDAQLDQLETTIGTTPILRIRTGAQPADCGTADSGTVLVTMNLPSDWAAAAGSGTKTLLGTWQDTDADNTGNAGHFRIYNTGDTQCHMQGSVTADGGGGDMTLDNASISASQQVTISTFTLTAGNA